MVKLSYFSGTHNKVKESFEIFLIDYYEGDTGNKKSLVSIKKFL